MRRILFFFLFFFFIETCVANTPPQQLVTIEMYSHVASKNAFSGGGVSTYDTGSFIVKTTDNNGVVTESVYRAKNNWNPIETLPCLRKEIDLWLSRGYKLFDFNMIATGDHGTSYRYLVLLVKD